MKFLILHGSFGSPESNWFPALKEKLELLNQQVLVPRFPVDDWNDVIKRGEHTSTKYQNLPNWLATFKDVVVPWVGDDKVVVVAHSLAPLFFLHAITRYPLNLDAAIFVSPFLHIPRNQSFWPIDVANKSFYDQSLDFELLKKLIPLSFALYSDHDPYVPMANAKEFASLLGSAAIPVLGAKHLSSEFNQNEFPLVLELCKSRVELTLYQKYLAHLSEYHPTDIVRKGKDTAMFMPSSELAKEGTFHFRNLSSNGFCTLPVKEIKYWYDNQGVYMSESRKAAGRVPITRVYILNKLSDKDNVEVKKSMARDKDAGFDVRYCLAKELTVPPAEMDFGIWDDSYVCTVLYEKDNIRFSLDSSDKRLKQATQYKKEILRVAHKL